MPDDGEDASWTDLADVLLQRAALVARVARDRGPDPLAGLKVDDTDLAALLGELPGLEVAGERAEEVEQSLASGVELAAKRFAASLDGTGRFATLARRAGLQEPEAAVLAVLCAVEGDVRRQRLVGYLNDDVTAARPTLWTLGQLCGPVGTAALGPGRPLRRACLVEVPADGPWASAPLKVAPSVMWWLNGVEGRDPDLPAGVRSLEAPGSGELRVAVAAGADGRRRRDAVCRSLRPDVFMVVPVAPAAEAGWDALIRQATLAGAGVVLEAEDELPPAARDRIEAAGHLCWGIVSPHDLPVACLPAGWAEVPVDPAEATDQEWEAAFGPGVERSLPLRAEQVELAGVAASAMGGSVSDAVRRLAAGHIEATANRIRPARTWDDLVLDSDREELIRTIALRCRQRRRVFDEWGFSPSPSKGVVALFAGPSGTGKTLAAEVIAGDLGVDLYAVDLANLVSKYIGETEKNLSRVFDAAEASNVALFFDEADALLGKRSAVSDAHDRYANIEVAYLLQRLERYEGLAVMATNLVNNLDPAFVRRLHVVVEFGLPGPAERLRIWQRCLPPGAPIGADLDLDALARRFEIAGGVIRNSVLGAAFLAAEAATPITMELALRAVGVELRKTGRLVSPADLHP
ncbi:MAG TPA: ATP-binding protein [Acidimicrobiales bacterium]|nr:ATP-binding protein [Acidimicrobiales bacterium]